MFLTQSSAGKNQWWRYLASLVVTAVFFVAAQIPIMLAVAIYAEKGGYSDADIDSLLATGGLEKIGVNTNLALALMLFPFAVGLVTLLLCIRFIHGRSFLSVLTSRPRFDLARVGIAMVVWFVVAGGLVFWVIPTELITYQFSLSRFLPLLAVAIVLLPFQVAAEEVLFRGYFMQGVARFFSRPIWPLVIVSLTFAAMHMANPEFQNGFLKIAPIYLLLSLFFGLLTVLDDGLELPIGAHLANNLFAALILSTSDGSLNTASIYQTQVSDIISSLWTLMLAIPVVMAILQVKYRFIWSDLFKRFPVKT